MTDVSLQPRPRGRLGPHALGALRTLAVLAGIGALGLAGWRLEPRVAEFLAEPIIVQAHVLGAVGALALGGVLLAWRKGRVFHRVFGWLWVLLVGGATLASAFIMNPDTGTYSWIHTMTFVTGIALPAAVYFAKRGNVVWHRRMTLFLYVAIVAGAAVLAFIPDRLMWRVFFGG
jgi:uncharacterized membrane protein